MVACAKCEPRHKVMVLFFGLGCCPNAIDVGVQMNFSESHPGTELDWKGKMIGKQDFDTV